MPQLQVTIASTRPGRAGLPIGRWAAEAAAEHGGFDVELVDLEEMRLPLLDEPNHPRMRKYTKEHTLRWSEKVSTADAFLFVTPEYNYGPPPALLNAVNFLHDEWAYKPAAFVSYGGVAAGLRSVQALKQVLTTLRMVTIPEGVAIPFVFEHLSPAGLNPPPPVAGAVGPMLDELLRWTNALSELRNSPPPQPPPPPPAGRGMPVGAR
ncbi:NADPH-dependent oxidoreductase [Trebonia kvetii]|uniref:NADPH-dependent oxidoreductase n=1 Tax=Trebonia kvetii TaxID=2480626 RepID=A0A6P2BL73_9ACTN|nr:NAD(P)H-dependent oxidoreductase [Trebonia kvetii]TVY99808.1 NADPH-dependent oxidoreductase [Trebonia kvetii]